MDIATTQYAKSIEACEAEVNYLISALNFRLYYILLAFNH